MTAKSAIAFAIAGAVIALALLPAVFGPYAVSFVFLILITFVLAQSWDWVNGQMGYLNLGHYAFYGLGAYTFAILLTKGASLPLCFIAAAIVPAMVAIVVSFPLFRLKGDYFAFATLAIVPLCELLASNLSWLTRGSEGITLPPHYVLMPAYYLAMTLSIAAALTTWLLLGSRFGYAMRAIRGDEQAAQTCGIRVAPVKYANLALSATFAGLAGAIQGWQFSFIDPYSMFNLGIALVPIAAALLGGSGLLFGALVGVIVLSSLQQVLIVKLTMLQATAYGVIVILIGRFLPGGLLRWDRLARSRHFGWLARESHARRASGPSPAVVHELALASAETTSGQVLLSCDKVTMKFGGITAVRDLSLEVRRGEIVGLVGPNGSGKTTLFNLISGVYNPTQGRVLLAGHDLSSLRPDEIAVLGIGRTYQIPRPFDDLTVRECIMIGRCFGKARRRLGDALRDAEEFAAFAGLSAYLDVRASRLSIQQKKALELARALASEPRLLLVDEAASGLSPPEIQQFADRMKEIRRRFGITIIWIEHIFSALAQVVDRLVVLEGGSVLADAPLADAVRDERVLTAYLGQAKPVEREVI